MRCLQSILNVAGLFAPQMLRRMNGHHVILDGQVNKLIGTSFDDQAIVAGELQLGPPPTATLGIGESPS